MSTPVSVVIHQVDQRSMFQLGALLAMHAMIKQGDLDVTNELHRKVLAEIAAKTATEVLNAAKL